MLSAPDQSMQRGFWKTCFPTLWSIVLALLACVVIPSSFIAIHIHENRGFSPIDEPAEYDYVSRIAQGSVPRLGQHLLPSTMDEISCRGVALKGVVVPPCPGTHNAKDYDGGLQYEAQQTPTYYAITVPIRWVGNHILGLDPVTAARAGGMLWLSAGLVLLWMTGMLLGLSVTRIVSAVLLIACGPVVIYQTSIVTNDAPAIFAGALIAFLSVLAWKKPGRWVTPTLALAGFFVASLKSVFILAPLIAAAVFAVHHWFTTREEGSTTLFDHAKRWFLRWLPLGGALLIGALVCDLAWVIIYNKLSLINPRNLAVLNVLRTSPVGLTLIAHEAVSLLNPLGGSYSPFRVDRVGTTIGSYDAVNLDSITTSFFEYLLIAGGAAGLFVRRRQWSHWLGLVSLAAMYVAGIVLGFTLWRTYNIDPGLSGRYALAAVPFLVLATVASARGRVVVNGLCVVSVGLVGLTYFYLLSG
jgi:hypothetical protein